MLKKEDFLNAKIGIEKQIIQMEMTLFLMQADLEAVQKQLKELK